MKAVMASSSSCRSFESELEPSPDVAVAAGREDGTETVPTTIDSNADATMAGTPPEVKAAMTEELNCGALRREGLGVALTELATNVVVDSFCCLLINEIEPGL